MEQHNYKLTIAYDGTLYSGWQIQPNATSIQSLIQEALVTLTRCEVNLIGSGRTDSGVHAMGQVAHFKCPMEIDIYRFLKSLNSLLPRDIRILEMAEVHCSFHAQHSASSKTYHYHLCLNPVQNPFKRLYSLHVFQKCDLLLLEKAAKLFEGKHDFTAFANESHTGSAAKGAVRTLYRLELIPEQNGIVLAFTGDGFLYKMVRNIVGTMLDVSTGKMALDAIPEIFASLDRRRAGQAAPAHGLFLMQVHF